MNLQDIRVLVNDDANVGYYVPPPMTEKHVHSYIKNMYANNGIDLLSWDVGINGSLVYDSEAGYAGFTGRTDYGGLETEILMTNYRGLAAAGKDIFRCVLEAGHRNNIGVMPAFRMGLHVPAPEVRSLYWNEFVNGKAKWTINNPGGTGAYGVSPGRILDYEQPEVREYMYGIFREAIDRYDADGIELNFIRGHMNFEADRIEACAPLLTELIEKTRNRLAEKRPNAHMAIRVPIDYTWAKSLGLDVEEWIRRGIVDILMPSLIHGTEFFRGIDDYAEIIRKHAGSKCRLLPTIQNGYTFEHLCGACDNFYAQGANGISSFNYHYQPQFKYGVNAFEWFSTFRDAEAVGRQPKTYPFVPKTAISTGGRPLPVWGESDFIQLSFTGKDYGVIRNADFPIMEQVYRKGGTLTLKIKQLTDADSLELAADGTSLPIQSRDFFVRDYWYPYIFNTTGESTSYRNAAIPETDMWPGWVITAAVPPGKRYEKLQFTVNKNSGFNDEILVSEIEVHTKE